MMTKYLCFCIAGLWFATLSAQKQLPAVQVETLDGERVNTSSLLDGNLPVVITFWSTTCKPCLRELDAFAEHFDEWQEEVRFRIAAISIDDTRSSAKVRGLAAAGEWHFTVLLDKNQDFKRAMNVNVIPHLFIADAKGNIIFSRIGYTPGSEAEVLEFLKSL